MQSVNENIYYIRAIGAWFLKSGLTPFFGTFLGYHNLGLFMAFSRLWVRLAICGDLPKIGLLILFLENYQLLFFKTYWKGVKLLGFVIISVSNKHKPKNKLLKL